MIKNYLKIAFRNFFNQWSFSLLNIAGLAVGLATSLLIFLWVLDELSYDRFHDHLDYLYRVYEIQEYAGQEPLVVYNTPGPLAPALKDNFPGFINVARVTPVWRQLIFKSGQNLYHESDGYLADKEMFEMFSFEFIYGDPAAALNSPDNIVLTSRLAEKYFGSEDPVGRVITVDNRWNFTVAGVISKPANTHMNFDFLVSFETNIDRFWGADVVSWNSNSFYTYVHLAPGIDPVEKGEKIRDFLTEHQEQTSLHLEPLSDSHLYNIWGTGLIHNIRIFTAVALIVLVIACINFMNLSTARSARRAREVGLRKVSGASRFQVSTQFLGESVGYAFFSLLLALVLVELLIPWFNELSGKELSVSLVSLPVLSGFFVIALFTGILSGSYPALYLSSLIPVKVLKGTQKTGSKSFRRTLVVFQFALSVGLIISTLVIRRQVDYIQNKDLGFDQENIISIYSTSGILERKSVILDELSNIPEVVNVSSSNSLPSQIGNSTYGIHWEGKDPDDRVLFNFLHVDFDFLETFGIGLIDGRSFSRYLASDSSAYIVNEEAARFIGGSEIVGKPFTMWGVDGEIIGVVKDFHFRNLRHSINPLVIRLDSEQQGYIHIRLSSGTSLNVIDQIQDTWITVFEDEPLNYIFIDQHIGQMYRSEQRMSILFFWFSVLAVIISCLGLFGLASYMAEQKTKEIGVRKVFGADDMQIMVLMIKEFIKWVFIAILIGSPLAWYLTERWLDNFAFRTGQDARLYIYSALIAVIIAIITVSWQAIRAAVSPPATSLRYE